MELVANYRSSEDNLYTVSDMTVLNCSNDLKSFSGHKKKYSKEYLNEVEAMIALARGIPNLVQRQATQDTLRVKLQKANETCCANAKSLQSYITTDGFKEEDIPAVLKLSGEDYYGAAAKNNWQATGTMMFLMADCISKYPEELANAGMPADFPATSSTDAQSFTDALKAYNSNKTTAEQQTAARLTANNALYDKIQSILNDGKFIFRKDAVMLKQYSYEAMLDKIRKKKTGYRIALTDAITEKPVNTASVSLVQGATSYTANKKGIIMIDVTAGNYDYTITAPGYPPVTGTLAVNTSVVHRDYIIMKKTEDISKEATA